MPSTADNNAKPSPVINFTTLTFSTINKRKFFCVHKIPF